MGTYFLARMLPVDRHSTQPPLPRVTLVVFRHSSKTRVSSVLFVCVRNESSESCCVFHAAAVISENIFIVTNNAGSLFSKNDIYPTSVMAFALNVYWSTLNPEELAWPLPPSHNASFIQWQAAGEDVAGVVADPLVASLAEPYNFTLLPGSPALARGFEQIDSNWGPFPASAQSLASP